MSNKIALKNKDDELIFFEFSEQNLSLGKVIFCTVIKEDSAKIIHFNGLKLTKKK